MIPYLICQVFGAGRTRLRLGRGSAVTLVAAVSLQLAAAAIPSTARYLVPLSFVAGTGVIAWVFWSTSHRLAPTLLAGLGGLGNSIPIIRHGAMPVRIDSQRLVADVDLAEPAMVAAKHRSMDVELSLRQPISLLTDWIPLPVADSVISAGDLVLVAAFVALGWTARTAAKRAQLPALANAVNSASDGSSAMASA